MLNVLKTANDSLYKVEKFFAQLFLILIVVLVFLAALLRTLNDPMNHIITFIGRIFGSAENPDFEKTKIGIIQTISAPLSWFIDISQLLFVWTAFFGADIALKNEKHIGIDLLIRNVPPGVRKYIKLCMYTLIIAFMTVIFIWGIKLSIINVYAQFSGLELSFSWATMSAPVGAFLMARTSLGKIYGLFRPESDIATEDIEEESNEECF